MPPQLTFSHLLCWLCLVKGMGQEAETFKKLIQVKGAEKKEKALAWVLFLLLVKGYTGTLDTRKQHLLGEYFPAYSSVSFGHMPHPTLQHAQPTCKDPSLYWLVLSLPLLHILHFIPRYSPLDLWRWLTPIRLDGFCSPTPILIISLIYISGTPSYWYPLFSYSVLGLHVLSSNT